MERVFLNLISKWRVDCAIAVVLLGEYNGQNRIAESEDSLHSIGLCEPLLTLYNSTRSVYYGQGDYITLFRATPCLFSSSATALLCEVCISNSHLLNHEPSTEDNSRLVDVVMFIAVISLSDHAAR